jgi:16S rRNA processing protein RimM
LLGTLQEVKPGPAYDIWVIDGPYGELEIPAVADYIAQQGAEQITLSLPRDFIEMTGNPHAH